MLTISSALIAMHRRLRQWRESHHAKAMAPATPESVRGNFDNTEFKHQGVTTRFSKMGEKFIVSTEGADGQQGDFEISYTFGVAPLQQYLIAQPGGRLQALQIAWDSERKRWFHLSPNGHEPPGGVLHWTGRYQTANTMCISCHTTGFERRYNAANDSFASRWKESNVSCQSCHGPGERHIAWAKLRPEGPQPKELTAGDVGFSFNLQTITSRQKVDLCASCHSHRSELTTLAMPGEPRLDHFRPSLLTEGLYHADGQQLDEVFVDGSFRQSKMYSKGVSCTNCHSAHSGKTVLAGNSLCTQCHSTQVSGDFPSAAGQFDTPAHHFHRPDSTGAKCVACHMPAKNYMQIQSRPDHSLRVPRPDLTVKIGTPNACNGCHTDRSAQWAADKVKEWYGDQRARSPHYGEAFAAAREGQPGAASALLRLAADSSLPSIVRATALDALRGDGSTGLHARVAATHDADPEVRAAAADSLEAAPVELLAAALDPLLRDPVRAVRIAAVRSLSTLSVDQMKTAQNDPFDAALAEYVASQNAVLDMPAAQVNLAVVYQNQGHLDLAEKHYQAALRIDPDFYPARANLARLYNITARNRDAEQVLKAGLKRTPNIGDLHYSLALLLSEMGKLSEATVALERAAELIPQRPRVHYNLGLAFLRLGRLQDARAPLLHADKLAPDDPAASQALATLFARSGETDNALKWAERWAQLAPTDPQAKRLLLRLRSAK